MVFETLAYVKNVIPVTNPFIELSGSYEYNIKGTNYSGCFYKKVQIEMSHFSYMTSIVKDADYKLTVVANQPLPPVLFR